MKGSILVDISLLVLAQCAGALTSVGVSFGPHNCVRVSRSAAGSCVITTDCEGVDISQTEFAFDCHGQSMSGDVVRHSFGVGGFEASEEFDTEVKCGRCANAVQSNSQVPKPKATVKKVEAVLKPAPVQQVVPKSPPLEHAAPVMPKVEPKHTEVS